MSTQLILYPQRHKGYISTFSTSSLQYLVDGIYFSQINTSTSYDATDSPANVGIKQAIDFQHATTGIMVNTWYRVRSNWTGSPALPLLSSGNLVLDSVSPGSFCGVYQRLSNLVVGSLYTVVVDWSGLVAPSYLRINHYNGTTLNSSSPGAGFANVSVSQITWSFTAQSPNDIIAFSLLSSINSTLMIEKISIATSVIVPTEVYTDLQDGQVICDLYQEEDIPLTLSIDDFKNVAEQVKSYSKDFDLPATKRNNQIFDNMFEITRADDGLIFNPYIRTKAVLKQDGFVLFEGYLRLIQIKDKEGEISYNVNLYSEVIALADILKDSTFSDLDFTELAHDYNKGEIRNSWNESPNAGITYINPNTSGFRDANDTVKYPFIDWTGQISICDGSNTSATINNPELTTLEQAFRPCIQLKYLINRIFAAAGFNWSSNFFDSADFEKLYMDFNWGDKGDADIVGLALFIGSDPDNNSTTSFTKLELPSVQSNAADLIAVGWDLSTNELTATTNNATYNVEYSFAIYCANTGTVDFQWVHKDSGGNVIDIKDIMSTSATIGNMVSYTGMFGIVMQIGDTLEAQFKSNVAAYFAQTTFGSSYGVFALNPSSMTTNILLQTLRGELGQWDFLKGIMTMFNLVSMVDESNADNILIEPYGDIFINNTNSGNLNVLTLAARSIQHDWTDKIDASQMELKPLTDLNKKTTFKFVEDEDDYAFNLFKQAQSGHLYGSLEWSAAAFTILEGTEEIIAEPFAATVSKPMFPQFSNFIIPSLYAMNDDGTCEGFDNSPRIFYNNGVKSTGASYFIPEQNGLSSENQPDFLQFSHLSDVPTTTSTRDFVFTSSQLVSGVGTPPVDNLFNIYWLPYYNELYSADTRTMTLKVNLSPSEVATFKFYDTVFIKNRVFRVNKIEYKPNSLAKVEFILL